MKCARQPQPVPLCTHLLAPLLGLLLTFGGGCAEAAEPDEEDVALPSLDTAPDEGTQDVVNDTGPDDLPSPPDPGPGVDPGPPVVDDLGPTADPGPGPACTEATAATDCDDGIECTIDECKTGKCLHTKESNLCCVTAEDCTDGDECTHDLCAAHHCVFPRRTVPECKCIANIQCDAKNPCQAGKCSFGICKYSPTGAAGCCDTAADCGDGDESTFESCQQGICWITDTTCSGDEDCTSPAPCVTSSCTGGSCQYDDGIAGGCCETEAECDDAIELTTDQCVASSCVHSLGTASPCASDSECAAPNACVQSTCKLDVGLCTVSAASGAGCCSSALDCPGSDPCLAKACEDFQCTSTVVPSNEVLWEDNFDVGGLKWAVEGDGKSAKWQLVTNQAISKPHALYYGIKPAMNYATGSQTTGSATSPVIPVPAGKSPLLLTFSRNVDTEPGVSTDKVWLELIVDGVATKIWDKGFEGGPGVAWKSVELDITATATGPFQLRFHFDSVDGKLNRGSYEGVYVDNVRLESPCKTD